MQQEHFLSIVIPAYNEEENISATLAEIEKYLSAKGFSCNVIVVDDGSKDNTVGKVRGFAPRSFELKVIESKPNRGKGYVLKRGILETKSRYVMFMDADNSTSIYEMDKFLPFLEQGYDAVIGSRRLKDSDIVVSEPAMRILLGQVYIFLSKALLLLRAGDINCGFKAYSQSSAKKIFSLQRMGNWSFDAELLFLLQKLKMKIKEVPVRWAHKSTSKVKPLKNGIESFLSLLKIRINDLRGLYESRFK